MAPTNPTEGQHSSYRHRGNGSYFRGNGRNNYYRRTENMHYRSEFSNQEYNFYYNNNDNIAGNNHYGEEPRPIRNKKDRGGGRGSGARRKDYGNKSNPKIKTDNAKRDRVYSECSDEHCPVCLNRMQIYAVGMCNHPVCSECSTRMRILCGQNECPICRQDMPKVIHTMSRQKFEDIQNNIYIMDRKYKICFEDETVQRSYKDLLQHTCPICNEKQRNDNAGAGNEKGNIKIPTVFSNFKQLDTHVRREHEMFYCDLCADNLKIFSHERKLYSRSELATHRRKGDENDSSHKGHPLCEFCQARWVDSDELFRHLRRDHFFCHFCDADGKQVYYDNYDKGLREHFKQEHYLCEEGDCVNEQFTSAFRDEIDLKAHMSERHSSSLSKAAAKQIRTVDVDFTYTRPGAHSQVGRRRGRDFEESVPSHGVGVSVIPNSANHTSSLIDQVDGPVSSRPSGNSAPVMTTDNFPSLGGNRSQGNANSGRTVKSDRGNSGGSARGRWAGSNNLTASGMLDEEFPSLTGKNIQNSKDNISQNPIDYTSLKQKGVKKNATQQKSPEEQFPSLWSANSTLLNFREAQTTPVYRNMPGYQPAWNSSNKPTNDNVSAKAQPSQNSSDTSTGMVTLSKKSGKNPAPMPSGIDEFPDLEAPSKNNIQDEIKKSQSTGASQKKKKNKSKKGGFIGEDLVSVRPSSTKSKASEPSSLATAADLISIDSSNDDKQLHTKIKNTTPKKVPAASMSTSETRSKAANKKPEKEKILTNENGIEGTSCNENKKESFPALGESSNRISAHFVKKDQSPINSTQGAWMATKLRSETESNVPEMSLNSPQKPPPGFVISKLIEKNESTAVPPPGFQGHTSTLQGKQETKGKENHTEVYIPPKNFTSRNSELLKLITNSMGGSKSSKFLAFKTLSSQFRSGAVSCDSYHKQCLELVDTITFELFFPELLCLLPDIQKQQELYAIHISKYPRNTLCVLPCPSCGQIVGKKEQRDHIREHSRDEDFPQLS